MDSTFLYNCKGALYPFSLDSSVSGSTSKQAVKSLVDLCANCIVHDSTATRQALDVIPTDLSLNLMKAALLEEKDRAVFVLLSHWPGESLTLKKFVSHERDHVTILYNRNVLAQRTRRAVKYTTCLVTNFVDCLKRRMPTKLKYLDLTGFPTAEVVTHYLCTHCLLISKESRQKELIQMYNTTASQIPHMATNKYSIEQTFPDDSFVVKLDVYIKTEEILIELSKALQASRMPGTNLKVIVDKVDVSCLSERKVAMLMDQLNTESCTGLRLQYSSLTSDSLVRMKPSFCRLHNLVTVDVSCNNIVLTHNAKAVGSLASTLRELRHLRRLDLSNNWLRENLRPILAAVVLPLKYLSLSGCCLKEIDIAYLASSHHCTAIEELDISDNNLSTSCTNLMELLKSCRGALQALHLENCKLTDSNILAFSTACSSLQNILYINLTDNNFGREVLLESSEFFARIKSLYALKLTYPHDFQVEEDNYEDFDVAMWRKADFCLKFEEMLRKNGSVARLVFTDYE